MDATQVLSLAGTVSTLATLMAVTVLRIRTLKTEFDRQNKTLDAQNKTLNAQTEQLDRVETKVADAAETRDQIDALLTYIKGLQANQKPPAGIAILPYSSRGTHGDWTP